MPLLIDVDRGVAPTSREAEVMIAFAERVAANLGRDSDDVLNGFARAQHAVSWAALLARKPGGESAGKQELLPLYTAHKIALQVELRPSTEELSLVERVGKNLSNFVTWPIMPTRAISGAALAERLQSILVERPDFLRGHAMLGAALDNLRDPTCLEHYEQARAGVRALFDTTFGRPPSFALRLPSDIPANRWFLDVGRLEAWALVRYHANFGGAIALTIGRLSVDPSDLDRVMCDQIAFACAGGSWDMPFGVKKHDMAIVMMSGLFRLLRSVAYNAQLDPKGLAQLLQAWVTEDWAPGVLLGPVDQLELIDSPTRIGACLKLVREHRASEFEGAMARIAARPLLLGGIERLIAARKVAQASTLANPGPTLNEWGRNVRAFISTTTGLPKDEV